MKMQMPRCTAAAALVLATLLVMAGAVRVAAQAPPSQRHPAVAALLQQIAGREKDPAEQVFKNIQTFKGMPARQVLAIMEQAFVPNLGVECTHCHVEGDWASDAKPQKPVTREMWALRAATQEQIRRITGNPKAVVTCYTCHKGQPTPAFAPEQPPRAALAGELARVEALASRVIPADQRAGVETRLTRAKAALGAGRLHLAIFDLETVFTAAGGFDAAAQAATVKTLEGFEDRWRAAGEPSSASGPSTSRPVLIEALAASAEARAPVTYRAALPYARDAGVPAGLFYLGESRAMTAFAAFARALDWRPAGPAPPLRSIAGEIDTFEAEVTEAYETMDASQHTAYVVTSVALKRARALAGADHHAGALLEYLLARLRFAPIRGGPSSSADLPARVARARDTLAPDRDHSIALLFLELAETLGASGDDEPRRQAAAILDDVLPAYHAALGAPRPLTAPEPDPAVTVTLLRWPFT
jgi:hypothetical protein